MKDGEIFTLQTPSGRRFTTELALSGVAKTKGLMFRRELEPGTGMFFLYTDAPQRRSMWMKNMSIPLDILWLSGDLKVLTIRKDVPPCGSDCESVSSYYKAQHAIELGSGQADALGIRVGDTLTLVKRK